MSRFVLTNVRYIAVGADLTGASNKVEITSEIEDKDVTNYASNGWKEVLGGLASAEISGEGQWEAGDPALVDDATWATLGGTGPYTVCPASASVGSLAYLVRGLRGSYTLGESVGEVAPWSSGVKSSWPLVRGVIAHPPGTARTATGTGTALELGALAAGQRLYAGLHILSAAGTTPSVTARIESDADSGFGSPTTRLTFDAATAPGGQILRTDGTAITDTHFRVAWDITGTSPSFLFVVSLGIR